MADLVVATGDFNEGVRPLRGSDWIVEQLGTFTPQVALTSGQLVRIRTDNKIELADASAAGTADVRGMVIKKGATGGHQNPSVHMRGAYSGFSGTTTPGPLYLSDTAGAISTTPGTVPVPIGFCYMKDGMLAVFLDISPAAVHTAIDLATV